LHCFYTFMLYFKNTILSSIKVTGNDLWTRHLFILKVQQIKLNLAI